MTNASTLSRTFFSVTGAAVFAAICLTGAVAPARAATIDTVAASARVTYADLDLTNPGARTTLDRRIKAAARSVCATNSRELKLRLDEMRCVKDAIANAVRS